MTSFSENNEPDELISSAKVSTSPETFNLISLTHNAWLNLLEDPALSPRMTAPFMIFKDQYEVTMLLDDEDFATIRYTLRDAKIERGFRLITFEIELDLGVVGFLARIAEILAAAGISIVPVSAFSRDHLLIRQNDLAAALKALGPHVAELC